MIDKGIIKKRLKEFEKKRDKYYTDYQQAGNPSSYRTYAIYAS